MTDPTRDTSPDAASGGADLSPPEKPRDPLVIREITFLGGMAAVGGWRPDHALPEVAFAGRSNVGKSSLLNALVRRKAIARVSRTPGRTREINFFGVNGHFALVDLPGYGYARVSKERKAEWRPLMDAYLRHTRQLRGVVQLLDVRRDPSDDDLQMLDYLAELEVPMLIAVTKVDKLSRTGAKARIAEITRTLMLDPEQVIPFSAHTGQGRDELAEAVVQLVNEPAWGTAPAGDEASPPASPEG